MRIFTPSRPDTTKVKRWTWTRSRGLWVEYVDGFRWKSDWTLPQLLAGGINSGDGLPAEEVPTEDKGEKISNEFLWNKA